MQVVETKKIKLSEIVFDAAAYPRAQPRGTTVEQYADALRAGETFPPIDLDAQGLVLLDGYHRWKAHQETGATEIEARLIRLEGTPRLLYAAARNAMHGDRLAAAEKREVARQMAEQGVSQSEIQRALRVSIGTINSWVSDITQRRQRAKYANLWWLMQLGWTDREIETATGAARGANEAPRQKLADLKIVERLARGQTLEQIAHAEDVPLKLVEVLALAEKEDEARLAQLKIHIQPYDVWSFQGCDPRFGGEFPGRIPGQLALHILYFFTAPGEVVLDPMAGSGTMVDACAYLNRRVYAYDAQPVPGRADILAHDFAASGWPERTAQARLIFWDPPYYKKLEDAYGEKSISRLERKEYLSVFERAARTIPAKFKGRLALLVSDYDEPENPEESIFVWQYVELFTASGWKVERRIQVPLTTQQVHPDLVLKFRAARRLARLGRDLVILRRD